MEDEEIISVHGVSVPMPEYHLHCHVRQETLDIQRPLQCCQARAIENQAYVVGVNRVGKDGNGIEHNGHSAVINSLGEYLFYRQDWDKVKTLYLSYTDLVEHRSQFPVGLDADIFSINL